MVCVGDAFKSLQRPFHVFVVITPPDEDGNALVVNFSSLAEHVLDCSCVLQPADYLPYIDRPTVVVYRRMGHWNVQGFETCRDFEKMPPISRETLAKITDGAMKSKFTKKRFQDILRPLIETKK